MFGTRPWLIPGSVSSRSGGFPRNCESAWQVDRDLLRRYTHGHDSQRLRVDPGALLSHRRKREGLCLGRTANRQKNRCPAYQRRPAPVVEKAERECQAPPATAPQPPRHRRQLPSAPTRVACASADIRGRRRRRRHWRAFPPQASRSPPPPRRTLGTVTRVGAARSLNTHLCRF